MFRSARLAAVVLVVIVGLDVRDVLVAEDANEAARVRVTFSGRRRVADDAEEDRAIPSFRSGTLHIAPRTEQLVVLGLVVFGEHAALPDIVRGYRHQLLAGQLAHAVGEETVGLAEPGAVDRVADAAAVCEARALHAALEVLPERLLGALAEHVVLVWSIIRCAIAINSSTS